MHLKFIDTYNAVGGAIIAVLAAIFGVYWYVFAAFLLLNFFDWLTGWYKARKLHTESSKEGGKGIAKKLGYWIMIAVAFLMSWVFVRMGTDLLHVDLSILTMVGWFTLACLMVNEVRSIIENLVECGYNVPAVLTKGLAIASKMINSKIDNEESEES